MSDGIAAVVTRPVPALPAVRVGAPDVFVERVRIGLWITLASNALFALTDVVLERALLVPLFFLKLAQVMVAVLGLGLLRSETSRQRAVWLTLLAVTVVSATTAASGILTHDAVTTPAMCTFLALATATVLPWDASHQLAVAVITALAIVWNADHVLGGFVALLSYPAVAIAVGVGSSVYLAAVLDRSRQAETRALAALRDSEENLRGVFENMQDVYFRNDLDGTIRIVSPSVRRYGYEPDELIGQPARVIYFDPDDQERVRTALFEQHSLADFETRLKCKDGSVVWASTSSHLVFDRQGRPVGFEGVLRDISARKRLEQQRADFMAMIAHDIRNPLTVIAGYTQMASESEATPADVRELLLSIDHSAQTLLALVKNYLQHAQIEAGQITLTKHPLRLNALLEELCRQYGQQCARRHINLELRLVPDLPDVNGDPVALERVFTNLVQNALKFTPDGGWITIRSGQEGPNVVASVADNGPGIAPEEVPKLFVRYGRGAAGRSQEGAGLGLFIVKALVEAHGGSVQVATTLGVGTRFVVSLPATAATSSA